MIRRMNRHFDRVYSRELENPRFLEGDHTSKIAGSTWDRWGRTKETRFGVEDRLVNFCYHVSLWWPQMGSSKWNKSNATSSHRECDGVKRVPELKGNLRVRDPRFKAHMRNSSVDGVPRIPHIESHLVSRTKMPSHRG